MYALYVFRVIFPIEDAIENGISEDDYQDVTLYGDNSELVKTYQSHEESLDEWDSFYRDTEFELTDEAVHVTYYVLGKYTDFDYYEVKEISDGYLTADDIRESMKEA